MTNRERLVKYALGIAMIRASDPQACAEAVPELLGAATAESDTVIIDTIYAITDILVVPA